MASCLPDTGSTQTIISSVLAQQANLKVINNIKPVLFNASGGRMSVIGSSRVSLRNEKHTIVTTALVVDDVSQGMLVSWHNLKDLGVIPKTFPSCAQTSSDFSNFLRFLPCISTQVMSRVPFSFSG